MQTTSKQKQPIINVNKKDNQQKRMQTQHKQTINATTNNEVNNKNKTDTSNTKQQTQ